MRDGNGTAWRRVKISNLFQKNRLLTNFRLKFKYVYLLGVINKNRNILDNYQESKVSKKYIFNPTGVKKGKHLK